MAQNESLTSIKVEDKLFDEFKITGVKYKISSRKLFERAMYLFIKDENFRAKILNQLSLEL